MGKAKSAKAKDEEVKVNPENVEAGVDASKVAGDPHAGNEPAEESKPAKAEKDSTTFVFKNGGSRTFAKSVHGKDWESLADEFEATNKPTIASRDGKAV